MAEIATREWVMSNPGGIAGAMDYQPATQAPGLACIVCGAEIHGGMKGSPSARAEPGIGIIHACSKACAADARFAEPLPTRAEVAALRAERDAAVARDRNASAAHAKRATDLWMVTEERDNLRAGTDRLMAEVTTLRTYPEAAADPLPTRAEVAALQADRDGLSILLDGCREERAGNSEAARILGDQAASLRAEVARLRELVRSAYAEGWHDRQRTDDPHDTATDAWDRSAARAALDAAP